MRKLLNKPWFVAVLACAAVVLVAQSVLDRGRKDPRPVARGDESLGGDVGAADARVETSLAAVLRTLQLPDRLPDPFAARRSRAVEAAAGPKVVGPDSTETVHLSALWEQGGAAYILLNGRICQPGETIGRITVAAVEREGVWLTHWRGRDFLRLGQAFTLITPAAEAANPRTAHHEG